MVQTSYLGDLYGMFGLWQYYPLLSLVSQEVKMPRQPPRPQKCLQKRRMFSLRLSGVWGWSLLIWLLFTELATDSSEKETVLQLPPNEKYYVNLCCSKSNFSLPLLIPGFSWVGLALLFFTIVSSTRGDTEYRTSPSDWTDYAQAVGRWLTPYDWGIFLDSKVINRWETKATWKSMTD